MSPVVIEPTTIGNIIGVGIVDKVFDLFAVFLLIFSLVFIIDLGFDIEESSSPVTSALPPMTLIRVS
jgi:hypothetical protein